MAPRQPGALPVGRFSVSVARARTWMGQHVARGLPAYESYRATSRSDPLVDADLLAPVLLHSRPTLEAYHWLHSCLPVLNRALADIPADADLRDPALEPGLLEPLFGILDVDDRYGVRMATLSKVLHRKRPHFVPLWDLGIRTCYYGADGPVPAIRGRSRGRFAVAVATAIREDLWTTEQRWTTVAAAAGQPAITPLRALDIIAGQLIGPSLSKGTTPRVPLPRQGLRNQRP